MNAWILEALLLCLATLTASGPSWGVGRWMVYRLQAGPTRTHFLRLALVRPTTPGVTPGLLWLEMEIGTHPELIAPLARLRAVVDVGAGRASHPQVEGLGQLLSSVGLDAVAELPVDWGGVRDYWRNTDSQSDGGGALPVRGRRARIRTHAGELDAIPITWSLHSKATKRLWISDQLPLWGVARWEVQGLKRSMEIWSYGEGAVTAFPESAVREPVANEVTAR